MFIDGGVLSFNHDNFETSDKTNLHKIKFVILKSFVFSLLDSVEY